MVISFLVNLGVYIFPVVSALNSGLLQYRDSSTLTVVARQNEQQHQQHEKRSLFVVIPALVSFTWYLVVISFVLLGSFTIHRKNTKHHSAQLTPSSEGVSILRPLKGIDTEMEACLSSAFEQDYPNFEILFCVEDESDAAVPVVKRLIDKYPNVDARLLVGSDYYGPNPKINNLGKAYRDAKFDILWVLDSNVWVSPGAMGRAIEAFNHNPRVKLVHHLPMAVSIEPGWEEANFGAKLDEMFLLTSHAKFYTAINTIAIAPCVTGKSNFYRRSTLDKAAGGIYGFARYIAEDNMIAEAIWKYGGRTAMTCDTVVQPQSNVTLKGYLDRRVRWLRVRRYMVLVATMIEPTTESIVCGILGAFGTSYVFRDQLWSWWYFLIHMFVWCAIDYWQYHNLLSFDNVDPTNSAPYFVKKYYAPDGDDGSPRSFLRSWLWVWLARELLALPIWVKAMSGHVIIWRTRPFRILNDLTAEEIGRGGFHGMDLPLPERPATR